MRTVAVTGVGWCAPLGSTPDEALDAILAGRTAIGPVRAFEAGALPMRVAAEVDDEVADAPGAPDDRKVALLLRAARALLAEPERAPPSRRGVFLGTGLASVSPRELAEDIYPYVREGRVDRALATAAVDPGRVAPGRREPARATRTLAERFGARGSRLTSFSACAASAEAIAAGARAVARGEIEVALVGGHDAMIHPLGAVSFLALGALSTRAARPLDSERTGFSLGEGAAVLRLEADDARRPALGWILGAGASCDAHGVTAPRPDGGGAEAAMRAALRDAGLSASQVGWVKAHATGTPLGDAAEAAAVARTFGAQTPMMSFKGAIGHTLAASGAVELALVLAALRRGVVPPTVGCSRTDLPGVDVTLAPRPEARGVALCNSFGFGGQNVCLAVGRGAA